MPSSSIATMPPIIRTALSLEPKRIVDLGMGTGKYGLMLREQSDWAVGRRNIHLTGVETCEEYIGAQQRLAYDKIIVQDIRGYLEAADPMTFDVALLNDVLEHFEPADGVRVVARALDVADTLLVSTPAAFFEQRVENPYEWHRSWWPASKLRELGRRVDANFDVKKIEHTLFAAFSRHRRPVLVYDPPLKALIRAFRDRFVAVGQRGPTI